MRATDSKSSEETQVLNEGDEKDDEDDEKEDDSCMVKRSCHK
jgi:hypothetical protein